MRQRSLAEQFNAELCGPRAEREGFPFPCTRWLGAGDQVVAGLEVFELAGSKTPGELALVLEDTTLITGDLVRAQCGGKLNLLPPAKLSDPARARESITRLLNTHAKLECVLVGDGWPLWSGGLAQLRALM